MSDAAQAATGEKPEEKEADHHPYYRPKDAATLILVDRSQHDAESAGRQASRQGRVHARQIRVPRRPRRQGGQPHSGGGLDPARARGEPSEGQPQDHGVARHDRWRSRRSARPARKPASASAARPKAPRQSSTAPWKPFADAGLLPDPSGLFLIARAITPPGRIRRFDTRFFTADASAITHRVEGVIHPDAELVELVWVEIGSKPLADLHPDDQECARRTGAPPCHRAAAP